MLRTIATALFWPLILYPQLALAQTYPNIFKAVSDNGYYSDPVFGCI